MTATNLDTSPLRRAFKKKKAEMAQNTGIKTSEIVISVFMAFCTPCHICVPLFYDILHPVLFLYYIVYDILRLMSFLYYIALCTPVIFWILVVIFWLFVVIPSLSFVIPASLSSFPRRRESSTQPFFIPYYHFFMKTYL